MDYLERKIMSEDLENLISQVCNISLYTGEERKEYNRQKYEANKQILEYIKEEIENHHELRFIQILWKLGIVDNTDRFAEESKTTLNRVKIKINNNNEMLDRIKEK